MKIKLTSILFAVNFDSITKKATGLNLNICPNGYSINKYNIEVDACNLA